MLAPFRKRFPILISVFNAADEEILYHTPDYGWRSSSSYYQPTARNFDELLDLEHLLLECKKRSFTFVLT